MKFCKICNESKELQFFHKHKSTKDGFRDRCKICRNKEKRKKYIKVIKADKIVSVVDSERQARYYIKNKEKIIERTKIYFKNNRDRYRTYAAKKYVKHKDKINSKNNKYKEKNRQNINNYQNNYYRQNRGYFNFKRAERRAYRLKATLVGFEDQVYEIYKKSTSLKANSGLPVVVDHIIPLKHKDICGLHVPWNLQIIDKYLNSKKKNSFDGTYDNDSWREVV